jgi:hypothetical protein
MTGTKRLAADLGYAVLLAAAAFGCLLVTADDLRADTGEPESCFSYCFRTTGGPGISDCISACCSAEPWRCGGVRPSCAGSECNNTDLPCTTYTEPCAFQDPKKRCNNSGSGRDCSDCSCKDPITGDKCRCAS